MPADEGLTCTYLCPVSLKTLKEHLRIEHSDEDAYLRLLLDMAWSACRDFCKVQTFQKPIPSPVRLAILLFAGHFYAHREANDEGARACMTRAMHALLWPYRDAEKLV